MFERLARTVVGARGRQHLPIALVPDSLEDIGSAQLRGIAHAYFPQFLARLGVNEPARRL